MRNIGGNHKMIKKTKTEKLLMQILNVVKEDALLQEILNRLKTLEAIMATLKESTDAIQATVDGLADAVTKLAADDAKALADLKAAQGTGNQAEIDAAIASLTASNTKLGTIAKAISDIDAADIAADPASAPTPPTV